MIETIARHRFPLALLSAVTLFMVSTPLVASTDGDQQCLRCHAMSTLAYRNPVDGTLVELSIDAHALRESVHGELACRECHDSEYRHYPHPAKLADTHLECVACHSEKSDKGLARFSRIEQEYQHSVHAQSDDPELAALGCHACHDPHRYRNPDPAAGLDAIVQTHNGVCLDCHAKLLDPLSTSHEWLPQRERHWESVRCLDCHTPAETRPGEPTPSHQILAAAESQASCLGCHSRERQLLARLYRFRAEENLADSGWLPSALYNDAYVVGMSGTRLIDAFSLALLGLMAALIGVHATLRYRLHRAATRKESSS